MAYLALSNGMVFEGRRIGAKKDCAGELVFTTGVVGYLETLTDPAYAGQIVLQTFPLIGNYGTIEADLEGEPALCGYVVREISATPSNFRSEYELNTYLEQKGICGICGVDTREITRVLREEGPLTAFICDEVPSVVPQTVSHAFAAREKGSVYPARGETKYRVTLIDYGAKQSFIRGLCQLGYEVKAVPASTAASDILADEPDGIILSGGPELSEYADAQASEVQKLIGQAPMLGVARGHQLAALALGGRITKMQRGHRGANQPVRELSSGRVFMTQQNHGWTVDPESLPKVGAMSFQNMNDGTCEGMIYRGRQCFTVQFEPEFEESVCHTAFVWDLFTALMGGKTHAQR